MNTVSPHMLIKVLEAQQQSIRNEVAQQRLCSQTQTSQRDRFAQLVSRLAGALIRFGEHLKTAAEHRSTATPRSA